MGSRSGSESEYELRWWSDLPQEVLEIISRFLKTKTNISRLRAICKSWRSTTINPFDDPSPLPLTLTIKYHGTWLPLFFRWVVTETKLYHVTPSNKTSSSPWSWLLKLKQVEHGQFLIMSNPSSSMASPSPPPPSSSASSLPKVINCLDFRVSELCTLSNNYINCFIISSVSGCYNADGNRRLPIIFPSSLEDSPNSVLAMSGNDRSNFSLYIKGDKYWTRRLHGARLLRDNADVISYGGKFCILYKNGGAVTVDSCLEKEEIEIAYSLTIQHCQTCDDNNNNIYDHHDKHLVDLYNGELLLVDICAHGTCDRVRNCIKVFKLNVKEKQWVEVKSLDGRILFIGWDYISFAVFAGDFQGCKDNCICINASYGDPLVYDLVDSCFLPQEIILHYTNLFLPPWSRTS